MTSEQRSEDLQPLSVPEPAPKRPQHDWVRTKNILLSVICAVLPLAGLALVAQRLSKILLIVIMAALIAGAAFPAFAQSDAQSEMKGDAAKGEQTFVICRACHQIGPGAQNAVGPVLNGVVGRKAGTYPGYDYSPANKDSGIVWTPEELNKYLTDPQKVVRWLREQRPLVGAELTRLADKVLTAVDHDDWPLLWNVSHPPRGVRMQMFCHAIRPMTLRRLAANLRDVRDRWEDILSLVPTTRAASA